LNEGSIDLNNSFGRYEGVSISGAGDHFTPGSQPPQTGIGRLLRDTYEAAAKLGLGTPVYFDYRFTPPHRPNQLLIAIENNFWSVCRKTEPISTILLSVNKIRQNRPHWLSEVLKRNPADFRFFCAEDNLYFLGFAEIGSDGILQLGPHNFVSVAHKKTNLPALTGFAIGLEGSNSLDMKPASGANQNQVLMYLGSICLRKGFLVIGQVARELEFRNKGERLLIHGRSSNEFIRRGMERLLETYPETVRWSRQFLEEGSLEFNNLFSKSALAIFPSREEGQQDAVRLAVQKGLISLSSSDCGYSRQGPDFSFDSQNIGDMVERMSQLLDLDVRGRVRIAHEQMAKMLEFDETKESVLKGLMEILERGELSGSPNYSRRIIGFLWLRAYFQFPLTNTFILCSRVSKLVKRINPLRASRT
jgi:hypothetical protein